MLCDGERRCYICALRSSRRNRGFSSLISFRSLLYFYSSYISQEVFFQFIIFSPFKLFSSALGRPAPLFLFSAPRPQRQRRPSSCLYSFRSGILRTFKMAVKLDEKDYRALKKIRPRSSIKGKQHRTVKELFTKKPRTFLK